MKDEAKQNNEAEFLKFEYKGCQDGYNSRDNMVEDEFFKIVQLFWLLLATLFLFGRFAKVGQYIHFMFCVSLGIAGFSCLFSLLVSMESNASCNVALRKRCREIEERLREILGFNLQYWQVIDKRKKHTEEKLVKGTSGMTALKEKREGERNIFINTVRLLIVLWVIVVVISVIREIPS